MERGPLGPLFCLYHSAPPCQRAPAILDSDEGWTRAARRGGRPLPRRGFGACHRRWRAERTWPHRGPTRPGVVHANANALSRRSSGHHIRRLHRIEQLRQLSQRGVPAVEELAPHQDDQADRRSHRRRRFRDGTKFADHGRVVRRSARKTASRSCRSSFGGREPETFSVDYTLGAKRYQGYLATLPEGRIYVLPVFWHVASKRWIDWKEITPIPDGAHDLRQIWNSNCFNCHATNIVQGYDVAEKKYKSTWTEMGIGCEACHGPGRPHVDVDGGVGKESRVEAEVRQQLEESRSSATSSRSSRRELASRGASTTPAPTATATSSNVFLGFKGGDRYADYAMPFLISEPIPENDLQGEFWPDGRPNRFNRPQALTLSGCFKAGAIVVHQLSLAHGSRNEFSLKVNITQGRNGDALCTQCHATAMRRMRCLLGLRTGRDRRREPTASAHLPRPARSGCAVVERGDRAAHLPQGRLGRLPLHQLSHERRELAAADPPPRSHVPAAGAGEHRAVRHPERVHDLSRRSHAGVGGEADERVVGRRRSPRQASASLADTMYRAGSGDAPTLPALAQARRRSLARPPDPRQRRGLTSQQLVLGTAAQPASRRRADADVVRRRCDGVRRQPTRAAR